MTGRWKYESVQCLESQPSIISTQNELPLFKLDNFWFDNVIKKQV